MAQVPDIQAPTAVADAGVTPGIDVHVDPNAFGAPIAAGLQDTSKVFEDHSLHLAQLKNQADVANVSSQLGQTVNQQVEDFASVPMRQNAQEDMIAAQKNIEEQRVTARSQLGNLEAQRMYDVESRNITQRAMIRLAGAAASQAHQYAKTMTNVQLKTLGDELPATLDTNDDHAVDSLIVQMRSTAMSDPDLVNVPPAVALRMAKEVTSASIRDAIDTKLATDRYGAKALLDKYAKSDYMTHGDISKLTAKVDAQVNTQIAWDSASEVVAKALAGTGGANDPEAVYNLGLVPQESSGQPGVVNKTTGAMGLGQVMPKTGEMVAGKLGIPWRPDLMTAKTPEGAAYQRTISHEYWQESLDAENGNITEALHHYYGGPDKSQWGPKTQQYAKDVLARMGPGTGPVESLEALQKATPGIIASVDAAVRSKNPNATAEDINSAEAHAMQILGRHETAFRAQEQYAQATVQGALNQQNENGQLPTTVEELTRAGGPDVVSAIAMMSPSTRKVLDAELYKNAHPKVSELTAGAYATFSRLDGMAINDASKGAFADMNLLNEPGWKELPRDYQNQLVKAQARVRAGQPTDKEVMHAIAFANVALAQGKANFPTDDNGKLDRTSPEYNSFISALQREVETHQQLYKKPMTVPEINDRIQMMLITKSYLTNDDHSVGVAGVPDEDAAAIRAIAVQNGRSLNDEQIQAIYRRKHPNG